LCLATVTQILVVWKGVRWLRKHIAGYVQGSSQDKVKLETWSQLGLPYPYSIRLKDRTSPTGCKQWKSADW